MHPSGVNGVSSGLKRVSQNEEEFTGGKASFLMHDFFKRYFKASNLLLSRFVEVCKAEPIEIINKISVSKKEMT